MNSYLSISNIIVLLAGPPFGSGYLFCGQTYLESARLITVDMLHLEVVVWASTQSHSAA